MTRRRKSTPSDENLVQEGSEDGVELGSAMLRVAVDGLKHLEPYIAGHLEHPHVFARAGAATALLVFWSRDEYLPAVWTMAQSDPDDEGRGNAASVIIRYAEFEPEPRRSDLLLEVLNLAEHSNSPSILWRRFSLFQDMHPNLMPQLDAMVEKPEVLRDAMPWGVLRTRFATVADGPAAKQ